MLKVQVRRPEIKQTIGSQRQMQKEKPGDRHSQVRGKQAESEMTFRWQSACLPEIVTSLFIFAAKMYRYSTAPRAAVVVVHCKCDLDTAP